MWIFSKKSPARVRCRPTRFVETRLADSIRPKARPVGKATTGRKVSRPNGEFGRVSGLAINRKDILDSQLSILHYQFFLRYRKPRRKIRCPLRESFSQPLLPRKIRNQNTQDRTLT